MIGSLQSPFPLENVTDADLQSLAQVLWNWEICESCKKGEGCVALHCSWRRSGKLKGFFDFYKEVTFSYIPELLLGKQPALRDHGDVLDIIRLLRSQPGAQRSSLTCQYFSQREKPPPPADQHRAFNLAVKIMTMVNCSAENQPSGVLELGAFPSQWYSDKTLIEFMERVFPPVDSEFSEKIRDVKPALTARALRKKAGLRFRRTDDLRNHLKLDAKKGVVEIYHCSSVLKEHLMASFSGDCLGFGESISVGNVPRQIALEALDSLQKVLFPFDSDSALILKELVGKEGFDPDCLRYDSASYRRQGEEEILFRYFGTRLVNLYEELEDPSPHGVVEGWFQRKSAPRFVMMATLVGVLIAIILGILGLCVGILQAWVSYQAWKHPVVPGA